MKIIPPDPSISLFVKSIVLMEGGTEKSLSRLPFYADGYPGIMFQESGSLLVSPQNKNMPDFFLYGQTIHPIELQVQGPYNFVVFQLYPFVIESFFGVIPKTLNDACYNLDQLQNADINKHLALLKQRPEPLERVTLISGFLLELFKAKKQQLDYIVQQALLRIIETSGQLPINELRKQFRISERAFERRFQAQVGLSPKQFSRIIQFQNSLNALQEKEFATLSDLVYQNGFADQSHFIRVFKAFTGTTPSGFTFGLV